MQHSELTLLTVLLMSYMVISCRRECAGELLSNVDATLQRCVALQSGEKEGTYRRLLGEHLDLVREPVHRERNETSEVEEGESCWLSSTRRAKGSDFDKNCREPVELRKGTRITLKAA